MKMQKRPNSSMMLFLGDPLTPSVWRIMPKQRNVLSTRIAKKKDFYKNSRKKNNPKWNEKLERLISPNFHAFESQENLRTNECISIFKQDCCFLIFIIAYRIGDSVYSDGKEMRRVQRGRGGEKLQGPDTSFSSFSVELTASAPPCVC